jgi:hypothetical protein
VSAGYLAVLVFALYVSNDRAALHYSNPGWLWLFCPLLMFWLSRLWFMAARGQLPDDPVQFALGDKVSWLVAVGSVAILVIAAVT